MEPLHTYRSVDKSTWGPGPWQEEPDKVQWRDPESGLPCLAVRGKLHGAWCGYVGVAEGHPLFGKPYNEPPAEDLEVHWGLTYAAPCDPDMPEDEGICHVPEPGQPDNV